MSAGYRGNTVMPNAPVGDAPLMQQLQQQQMQAAAVNATNQQHMANTLFTSLHNLVVALGPSSTPQSIAEIRDLAMKFTPISRIFLIRLLLDNIDFYDPALSIFATTNAITQQHKDYVRLQLLVHELKDFPPAELAKNIFTRFEHTPVLPDAFLASFAKATNLPLATQLVVLMMLAKSRDPRWSRDAFNFLAYLLHPDHVQKLVESKVSDVIITDLIQFVATCPLAYLRIIHKRRYLSILQHHFPAIFANSKLIEYLNDIPKADIYKPRPYSPSFPPLPTLTAHRTNNYRFADLLWDAGYVAFDSIDKVRGFTSLFRAPLNELDAAITLSVMLRTASALNGTMVGGVGTQKQPLFYSPLIDIGAAAPLHTQMATGERGGGTNSCRILPSSSFVASPGVTANTWNVKIWVDVWAGMNLNFYTIMRMLDQPEFFIPDQASFDMLLEFWAYAAQVQPALTQVPGSSPSSSPAGTTGSAAARFPAEVFLGLWSNRRGQLSALKKLIAAPASKVDFTAIPKAHLLRPIEDLNWLPPSQSKNNTGNVKLGSAPSQAAAQQQHQQQFHPWYCLPLIETLLSVVDVDYDLGYEALRSPVPVPGIQPHHALTLLRKDVPPSLFARAMQQCPEVLVCALVAVRRGTPELRDEDLNDIKGIRIAETLLQNGQLLTPGGNFILDELLDSLITTFISPHPLHSNSRPVIARLWMDAPRLVAAHMLRLYTADRAMLARVLDIVQDLKDALGSVLDIRSYPFCIDLAVLAAKRQFLNLEVWLSNKLRDVGITFYIACLDYLKLNAASAENPISAAAAPPKPNLPPGRKQPYNPLTFDTASTMFRLLSTADVKGMLLKENLPHQPAELIGELHRTFTVACQLQPKFQHVFTGRPAEVNREQAKRDAEALCTTLLTTTTLDESAFTGTLKALYASADAQQQALYVELICCLLEEAPFVDSFPEQQRLNMSRIYAAIIKDDLATPYHIGRLLGVVLEALASPKDSLYSFGMNVLQHIRERLTTWPAYCFRVSQVANVIARNKNLVNALEGVCKDAAEKQPGFELHPSEYGLDSEILAGLNRTRDGAAASAAERGVEKAVEVTPPPSKTMQQLTMILNNVTTANLPTKSAELAQLVDPLYYRHVAAHVMKRALTENNQAGRYAELLVGMRQNAMDDVVLDVTYTQTRSILDGDKSNSSNDRQLAKNIGTWLGTLTLARDKPIRATRVDLREEIYRACDNKNVTRVGLFICKLLATTKESKIFKPPNPWLMAILSLLKELAGREDTPNHVSFEVEDLFRKLDIPFNTFPASESLSRPDKRPQYNRYTIQIPASPASTASPPALAKVLKFIAQVTENSELLLATSSVQFPRCKLFSRHQQLKPLVIACLELAIRDILATMREKFLSAVTNAGMELATASLALPPAHTEGADGGKESEATQARLNHEVANVAAAVVAQYMAQLTPELFRKCFLTHALRVTDGAAIEHALLEECATLSCATNSAIARHVCERILSEQAVHTITETVAMVRREKGREGFASVNAVNGVGAGGLPVGANAAMGMAGMGAGAGVTGNVAAANMGTLLQGLSPAAQNALECFHKAVAQVHVAIVQVPNYKTTSIAQLLQMLDHPLCILMSQTIPACIKQALAVPNLAPELVFRFATQTIAMRLLDMECKGSLLHIEIYKTLLWNVAKGYPALPKDLAQRLLVCQYASDPERLQLVGSYVSHLLKDRLLDPAEVDEFFALVFFHLLTTQTFIANSGSSAPRPDVRLECWIQMIISVVLPLPSHTSSNSQGATGNKEESNLPIVALANMPRTADALLQAIQAVTIPPNQNPPQPYLILSHALANTFTRILEDAKVHPTGLVSVPAPVEHDIGGVGDRIVPGGHIVPGGACCVSAILSLEATGATAGAAATGTAGAGATAGTSAKSSLSQTHEMLLAAVDVRERALSSLDSVIGDSSAPASQSPTQTQAHTQVAQAVLQEWLAAHILDRSDAAYTGFAQSMWAKSLWSSRAALQGFFTALITTVTPLLMQPRTSPTNAGAGNTITVCGVVCSHEQLAEAVAALIVFLFGHVDTPLRCLTEQGRSDALYTDAGLVPDPAFDADLDTTIGGANTTSSSGAVRIGVAAPLVTKPAHWEMRIRLLRDFCLCVAETARTSHTSAHQAIMVAQQSGTVPPNPTVATFPAAAYGILLTSLISALAVPALPKPQGDLLTGASGVAAGLTFSRVAHLDLSDVDVALVIHDTLRLLSPIRIPAFVFSFIDCIGHRSLLPRFLSVHTRFPILTRYYIHLLLDLLSFCSPYIKALSTNSLLPEYIRTVYRATLRIFLLLFHDFPEVLAESAILFCDRKILPDVCLQLRNLILAAQPKHINSPPLLLPPISAAAGGITSIASRMDSLPEMYLAPRLVLDPTAALSSPYARKHIVEPLEAYLRVLGTAAGISTPFPADIISSIQLHRWLRATQPKVTEEQLQVRIASVSAQIGCVVDSQVLLALLMYLAHHGISKLNLAMQQLKQQGQVVGGLKALLQGNPCADATIHLLEALDVDTRHLALVLIANQLRYPNAHTHYFSALTQYIYLVSARRGNMGLCEHVVRVLLERLATHSPYPWGLLLTFTELARNPIFDLWKQPFMRANAHVEEMCRTIMKNCGGMGVGVGAMGMPGAADMPGMTGAAAGVQQ